MNNTLDVYYEEDEEFENIDREDSFFIHKTRAGKSLFIYEMDDDHLLNTIDLLIIKLEEAKKALAEDSNNFKNVVYQRNIDKESLKRKSTFFLITLQKYVFEAVIRKLDIEDQIKALKDLL